jgi:hypothetical protein
MRHLFFKPILRLLCVAVLLAFSFALAFSPSVAHAATTYTVSIPGAQPWTDTGIDLMQGSSMEAPSSNTLRGWSHQTGKHCRPEWANLSVNPCSCLQS